MNRAYWEARYQSGDTDWEKGAPSPGLVDFLAAHPELRRGSVCVPGCGTGHDVRAWAQAGFAASGFDLAPSAIRLATERTPPGGLSARFARADFLRAVPPERFDWIFEHTRFCAIDPADRDEYVRAVLRWLKPDGQYLAVNYVLCDPDGPPFPTTRVEQWQRFSPHFDLVAEWVPRSYPNRTGKELMLWWRRKITSAPQPAVVAQPAAGREATPEARCAASVQRERRSLFASTGLKRSCDVLWPHRVAERPAGQRASGRRALLLILLSGTSFGLASPGWFGYREPQQCKRRQSGLGTRGRCLPEHQEPGGRRRRVGQ